MAIISAARSVEFASNPSGTVTFLFTDIEGSTRLLEQLREEYAVLLEIHHQIFRAAFLRWNGHEVDTQGDSFFAVFSRATDAIACVVDTQRILAKQAWPQDVTVRVRMGLHTGESIMAHAGYVGMDIHRADRIVKAGYGGQVLLSQTTRDLVWQDLPAGISLRDLGAYKLKDIRYEQEIYQLVIEDLPCDFPPLKTLSKEEEPPTPGNPPFKGLQYFTEKDAGLFFGREQATRTLLENLRGNRFLAVIGASGSGKSSVLRAGLLPAIKYKQESALKKTWQTSIITPTDQPMDALAIGLTFDIQSIGATEALIDDMRRDARSLHLFIQKAAAAARFNGLLKGQFHWLLLVDQFEELFTQCRDEIERRAFINNLIYAATVEGGVTTVVIALRADFYGHLSQYASLRQAVAKNQEYLGAMTATELRQAIEEPARQGGWEFSPGLVDLILYDIGAGENHSPEPGALPLLSHALLETWEHRRGNQMTLKGYAEAGGVRGAIARSAERVYSQELTPDQQQIARSIFLRLTELGEGTQDTRRRVSISELYPPEPYGDHQMVDEVLVKLADARLITTAAETVEVAHEALIREWPTLREWLTQDREGLHIHRHLTEAAREWEILDHDSGALYRGVRLAQAREWAEANPQELNVQERVFLDASQSAAQREEDEREAQRQKELESARELAEAQQKRIEEHVQSAKRLRSRALFLTVALVLAGILAGAAILLGIQARDRANLASARELAAAAVSNLTADPERSILLALQSLNKINTQEGVSALHQALLDNSLVATIPAHSQTVFGVAYSPDGKNFASASQDGGLKIWTIGDPSHAASWQHLDLSNPVDFNISDQTQGYTLAYSPDGSQLAVITDQYRVRIINSSTGQTVQLLTGHTGNVFGITFSRDGKFLASASKDGTARIWEVATGKSLATIKVGDNPVYLGQFSPDGRYLLTSDAGYIVNVWDIQKAISGDPAPLVFSIPKGYLENHIVGAIAFSPDGQYVAISSGENALIWNYPELNANHDARPLFTLTGHTNNINSLVYIQDGSRLITGNADGKAIVWDATTGKQLITLPANAGMINSLAISPDGQYPITAQSDGTVKLWDISLNGSKEWLVLSTDVYIPQESLDGKYLLTVLFPEGMIRGKMTLQKWMFQPSGLKQVSSVDVDPGGELTDYVIYPDLGHVLTMGKDLMVKKWDVNSGKLIRSFSIQGNDHQIGHTSPSLGMKLSPDSSMLATRDDDGKAILWNVNTGKALFVLKGSDVPVKGLAFSPDNKRLATGSFDYNARIWDTTNGKLLLQIKDHSQVGNLIFSPDGKRLVTTTGDDTPRVWDANTGRELFDLIGHSSAILNVDYSSDGKRIATGSLDGTVRVWDAADGQLLTVLPGIWTTFTPDGKHLFNVEEPSGIWLGFYLDPNDLIAYARTRVTRSLTAVECQQYLHMQKCP